MKKKRTIFTKDWMTLHPFAQSDETDLYYANIADKVYALVEDSEYAKLMRNKGNMIYLSLCLTSWFEDVISQLGIWKAFSTECKRRYGTYIPFYDTDGSYSQDDINLADVKFLLWHHVQQLYFDDRFIFPNMKGLDALAEEVFSLFDAEYETAPENTRLHSLLCEGELTGKEFYQYRDVLKWLHFGCYFNVGNGKKMQQEMQKIMPMVNDRMQADITAYGVQNDLISNSRSNLLSLTTPEWMALISRQHPKRQIWAEAKSQEFSYYTIEREDDEYIYLKDLVTGEKNINVCKASIQMRDFSGLIKNKSAITLCLFWYGNCWWQNGIMADMNDKKITKASVAEEKAKREHTSEKAIYDNFKKATGGKWYAIFKDNAEFENFLTKDMGYGNITNEILPKTTDQSKGIIAFATPYCGLRVVFGMTPCVKVDDNPFYDKEYATEHASEFFFDDQNIPYEVSCLLNDNGMVPDASLQGEGSEGLQPVFDANRQFIIDYNLHGSREHNLSPKSLL